MAIVDRDALRRRLGRVGVWGTLALRPAEEERRPAAEVERLGYGALWFGEGPTTKEAFTHAAILLEATERIVVATASARWIRRRWLRRRRQRSPGRRARRVG